MAIKGLLHTSFTVADMDKSLDFWTGPLGCRLVAQGLSPPNTPSTDLRLTDSVIY